MVTYIQQTCIDTLYRNIVLWGDIPAFLKNPFCGIVVYWFVLLYRSSVPELKSSLECPMCRHPVKNYKALCGHMKMHGGWDKSKVQMWWEHYLLIYVLNYYCNESNRETVLYANNCSWKFIVQSTANKFGSLPFVKGWGTTVQWLLHCLLCILYIVHVAMSLETSQ